ncbi:MAG: cytochrome B6 [Chitinophagaceae bacterium]|nr:cytochrome B6 [Chitinophagaceae bacterium]MCA6455263.1 cytochrome B6 [Chitinophagaceae bacterium]MCA6460063.1 cytochrome B6 [Chitinophagaceae bacterium]MCA6465416.1 cytochrome B6 [Chitinophagaceae bacterium]
MKRRRRYVFLTVFIFFMILVISCGKELNEIKVVPSEKSELGRQIFFDPNLSNPVGLSCSSCHSPEVGFSDPMHRIVSEGAVRGLFSARNVPSIGYSMFSFPLVFDASDSTYSGGFFLDGRVNSLREQAKLPFFNKLEMNNQSESSLAEKVKEASWFPLLEKLYGHIDNPEKMINSMTDAISVFEQSGSLNPFSSKFDYYLKNQVEFTKEEELGLQLFTNPLKGNCASCHITEPDPVSGKILFTDFTYDNIGVPKNPLNAFYSIPTLFNPDGIKFVDSGLGRTVKMNRFAGQFKVPTLRNIAITAPYFHNGFFQTLEEVVHFYNKRDVESFPRPEVELTVNHRETGNLKLSVAEEHAIVAFMRTLTDGYK